MLNKFDKDLGILILRLGIGAMIAYVGYPKITAGPEMWEKIGGAMSNLGVNFAPTFWGFCAAFAEFAGGILVIAGFLFRPALALLLFTMFVAGFMHYANGDGFRGFSSALLYFIAFLGLFVSGPGKYALTIKMGGNN